MSLRKIDFLVFLNFSNNLFVWFKSCVERVIKLLYICMLLKIEQKKRVSSLNF